LRVSKIASLQHDVALSPATMNNSLTISAPAKVNLNLEVLGKRDDGFHEISSLMLPLELSDELKLSFAASGKKGEIELSCDDTTLPTDQGNLVYQAAAAYLKEWKEAPQAKLRIELSKHIPSGAGLGGGSSDAVATLHALQNLSGNALGEDTLHQLAAEIGSDLPFFLYQQAAEVRGRGEKITVVDDDFSSLQLLLVKPHFGVSAGWAYQHWEGSKSIDPLPYHAQKWQNIELRNDLERPVFAKYPWLGLLKKWLIEREEVEAAMMSGSGSTTFAILNSSLDKESSLLAELKEQFGSDLWIEQTSVRSAVLG